MNQYIIISILLSVVGISTITTIMIDKPLYNDSQNTSKKTGKFIARKNLDLII
jgi:hypothetical protein